MKRSERCANWTDLSGGADGEGHVRTKRSTLAGTWYPADRRELGDLVDRLLAESRPEPVDPLLGLVVPHAAYEYSGTVAAAGYRQLASRPCERAVILAPCHRGLRRGMAIPDWSAFATPLGLVSIDPITSSLSRWPVVRVEPAAFEGEHSLEIQLPFLQRVCPGARVVPLLFGDLGPQEYVATAEVLASLDGDGTVFLVSSDFTHYGWRFGYQPFPADDPERVRARLRALDMGAIEPLLKGSATGFRDHLRRTGDTICGRVPIAAFLSWSNGNAAGRLLAYRTSLDSTGDYEHCVSYAAIAFSRSLEE
jgi:AmmeMemoRadiSam system protein B